MSKVKLELGATFDIASADDYERILVQSQIDAEERELTRVAGIQMKRFRLSGTVGAAGDLVIGLTDQVGPREGYIWQIRRLRMNGAATNDAMGIYFGEIVDPVMTEWALTDIAPQSTFGKGQLTLRPGENLVAGALVTLTATSISITGEAMEVPMVMQGKLA